MKPIKSQTKPIDPDQLLLLQVVDQTKVVEKLCKLALREEKRFGKATAQSQRKAIAAARKLDKLVVELINL